MTISFSPAVFCLAIVLGGSSALGAESDSDFKIPETEIIKAMQAAVRADDKN